MNYDELRHLRRVHPGWRLLTADHAPLVVSFLHRTFVEPNVRTFAEQDLSSRLDDHLFQLRDGEQDDPFPKPALAYLKDWAADERGWLRKYYPPDGDEPHYDLTPATEQAIRWLASLEQPRFVGAESRLMTVVELLRQIVEGAETDLDVRLAELEKRKAAIEQKISDARAGRIELLDDTQLRERFLQMGDTAYALLADFRQVEQNFRELDRQVREKIASYDGSKGDVLEDVFGEHDSIAGSDQGRSFRAFWDFLMSPARQDELAELLERVLELEAVQQLAPDRRLLRVHHDWLDAGEVTQRTVARLSEQLRRYLDDQAWLENKRIMSLVRAIEQHALALRGSPLEDHAFAVDELRPRLELPMERPLFRVPVKPHIAQHILLEGSDHVAAESLFEQVHVDKPTLQARIRQALQLRPQISLAALLRDHPLELGLSELVAYMSLAAEGDRAHIDDSSSQTVSWVDDDGRRRRAHIPTVIFSR